jgi:hypothetical protein
MGVIKSLSSQEILVHFPEEDKTIEVEYEWQNIRYKIDPTKEIEEEVLGTLSITRSSWLGQLRKKPGIDFDKAAIDVSQVLCQVRPMLHYRVCAR